MGNGILSPARLPVPPPWQEYDLFKTLRFSHPNTVYSTTLFPVILDEMDGFTVRTALEWLFKFDSVGSIFLRAGIWFLIAIVIIAATDTTDYHKQSNNLRFGLGALFLFLILCGGLIYLMFGFVPTV